MAFSAGVFSAETGQVESKVFARAVDRVNTDNQEFPEVQMQAIPIMLKEGETWQNYLECKLSLVNVSL